MDNEFELMILRDFLGENWSLFKSFCSQRDVDPDDVYVAIGGESDTDNVVLEV